MMLCERIARTASLWWQWIVHSPRFPHPVSSFDFVSERHFVPVIGLIGGIGSGKSALARWLSARRQVMVIDADKIGHEALKTPQVKKQLKHRFGDSVFDSSGTEIDRAALGQLVFGSDEPQTSARTDLQSIVHPKIRETIEKQIREGKSSSKLEAVLLDAAVMLEVGWNDLCDVVVFVDTAFPERLKRVLETRGWNQQRLETTEASQISLESKRNASDAMVDNSGSLQQAGAQLEHILNQLHQNRG